MGSNGFLGSHLVSRLEALGHMVLRGSREGNIPAPVDYIIDCAAYGNFYNQTNIDEMIVVNYDRVKDLLKNAEKLQVKGIILTSTSSVTLPIQSPYSATKTLMEFVGLEYAKKLPIIITRPYTIYGIGDSPNHFIPKVFDSCLNGTPIPLDPEATHDYIWVGDVVDTYIKLIEDLHKFNGAIVDIGTGKAINNSAIVVMIEKLTNKKANITTLEPLRFYDIKDWKSNHPLPNALSIYDGLTKIYDSKQRTEKAYS